MPYQSQVRADSRAERARWRKKDDIGAGVLRLRTGDSTPVWTDFGQHGRTAGTFCWNVWAEELHSRAHNLYHVDRTKLSGYMTWVIVHTQALMEFCWQPRGTEWLAFRIGRLPTE